MANLYTVENTINYSSRGLPIVLRAGDVISDADYVIADLRAAGAVLHPADTTAVLQAQRAAAVRAQRARAGGFDAASAPLSVDGNYTRTGSATISGVATTQAVTFDSPELDASYNIQVTCTGKSAGAAAGSIAVYAATKTTAGFTLTTGTAPGADETVTADWLLTRN